MNLEECRAKIDGIDNQILQLFIERMKIVSQIARYKAEHHLSTLNSNREQTILQRISNISGKELCGYTQILFTTMFDLSRSYQRHIKSNELNLKATDSNSKV